MAGVEPRAPQRARPAAAHTHRPSGHPTWEWTVSRGCHSGALGYSRRMHYKNGREAKPGDLVVAFPSVGAPIVGLLHSAVPGQATCNARLAVPTPGDAYVTVSECMHVDDVRAAVEPAKP